MKIYGLYDLISETFTSIFPAHTSMEARRNVQMVFKNPQMINSPLVQSPNDFELWELCEVDKDCVKTVLNSCIGRVGAFIALPTEE